MCGRYTIQSKVETMEKRFRAVFQYTFEPVYNAAPSMSLPVITNREPKKIQAFQFGFLPPWAKKPSESYINAKSEGIIKTKAFQTAIREQRCLVPANCFFEWNRSTKQPFLVYSEETRLMAFGGIWRTWTSPEGFEYDSFAIITQEANKLMQAIGHHRMPLILSERDQEVWLRDVPLMDITKIMKEPYSAFKMNAMPVSDLVNKPENISKEILEPIGEKVRKNSGIVEAFTPSKKPKKEGSQASFLEKGKGEK